MCTHARHPIRPSSDRFAKKPLHRCRHSSEMHSPSALWVCRRALPSVCWRRRASSWFAVRRGRINESSRVLNRDGGQAERVHDTLTGSAATAKHFWIKPSNVVFSTRCSSGMGFFMIFSAGIDCRGWRERTAATIRGIVRLKKRKEAHFEQRYF